jgi:hypothetical protein
MSIHDRDYILRMVRRMVEMLGRVLGLERPQPEEARRVIDETGQSIFGPLYRTLRDADALTAAALVSDPEKRWAVAALLIEESKVLLAEGDARRSARKVRTAAEILLDLAAAPQGLADQVKETLTAIAPRIDPARLSEDRRRALARLS